MQRGRRIAVVGAVLCLIPTSLIASADATDPLAAPLSLDSILEIAAVDLPPEGYKLQVHADFPVESPLLVDGVSVYSVTADVDDDGGVVVRNAVTGSATNESSAAGECSDPTFTPMGVAWGPGTMPVKWRLNIHSTPDYLSRFFTMRAMRKAHQVWPRVHTDCKDDDDNGFHFNLDGLTRKHVKFDGVNVVDFGQLGSGALAVNYTWYKRDKIVEVDLRLNKTDYKWTNNPDGRNGYQVINVVAHELGHQLGLDDLADPHRGLTMYGRIDKAELSKVTLGKGDIKGAALLSP